MTADAAGMSLPVEIVETILSAPSPPEVNFIGEQSKIANDYAKAQTWAKNYAHLVYTPKQCKKIITSLKNVREVLIEEEGGSIMSGERSGKNIWNAAISKNSAKKLQYLVKFDRQIIQTHANNSVVWEKVANGLACYKKNCHKDFAKQGGTFVPMHGRRFFSQDHADTHSEHDNDTTADSQRRLTERIRELPPVTKTFREAVAEKAQPLRDTLDVLPFFSTFDGAFKPNDFFMDSENSKKGNFDPLHTYQYSIYHPLSKTWYNQDFDTVEKCITPAQMQTFRREVLAFFQSKSNLPPNLIAYWIPEKNRMEKLFGWTMVLELTANLFLE